ncbi:MAG: Veg family protein [Thermaerobacter sp.]|nr:Veg protein [Bacillota bacterium]REJ31762.1 MAG: Veg protein [Bacillota bacterium]
MSDNRDVLARIKSDLDGFVGHPVRIKAHKGRRRVVEREGTLEKTYPSLFVVKLGPDQQNRRVTFTYADILTETVELTVLDDRGAERLAFRAG